eukprot:1392023-Rhodomonas_salina.1
MKELPSCIYVVNKLAASSVVATKLLALDAACHGTPLKHASLRLLPVRTQTVSPRAIRPGSNALHVSTPDIAHNR